MTRKLKNVEEAEFEQFLVDENEIQRLRKRGLQYPADDQDHDNEASSTSIAYASPSARNSAE
jgi:hypothetical protein